MKLFLFRLSLSEPDQKGLFSKITEAQLTREEFLRRIFSVSFSFDHRKDIKLKYHFIEEVDGVIYAAICRWVSEEAETNQIDPFEKSNLGRWKKAAFLFNIKDDQQVLGIDFVNGVGRPNSVVSSLVETVNAITLGQEYRIDFFNLPTAGSFNKAVREYKGDITSVSFDLVIPNPPSVEDSTRKALRELREKTGAIKKKETLESQSGLKTESSYIQELVDYTEKGGGRTVAKSGSEEVYNSQKTARSITVSDDLRPKTTESKASLISRIAARLTK